MSKQICIVTPDSGGSMKNGGIGTACYWLARFLAQNGYQVTVLYTGPFQEKTFHEACAKYAEDHIHFLYPSELKEANYTNDTEHHVRISTKVYNLLKGQQFDVIHFQDWQGNGFSSIQAKKMGTAFEKTKLVVGVHSPLLWEQEGMPAWSDDPIRDCKRNYMEKYAIEHADSVWAPSESMLRWLDGHHIVPKGDKRVIHYIIRLDKKDELTLSSRAKDSSHLIFFGRLETRKGFELFTTALNKVLNSGKEHGIKRVSFLGEIGELQNGVDVHSYLNQMSANWNDKGIEWKVIPNFDASLAIRYIQKAGAIVVIPSLLDHCPYAVLECIENQIPCLASSTEGVAELLSPKVIFDPTVDSLCDAIYNRDARTQQMRGFYSNEQAKKDWLAYSEFLESAEPEIEVASGSPRVSVCVAYYNYGRYLPQLMMSLGQNDYQNFEVIVVNDGSTDPLSIQVFEQQQKEFSPRGWKFISHENQGIGATRNFAASHASGEHLIFMDADNVAAKNMISTFIKSLTKSGADALTCLKTAFKGDCYPDEKTEICYLYHPIGPILEIGMLENIFGDANAIIRKRVFDQIGGFKTDRSTSFEDWQFFALLVLKGYKLDVIPEQLFYYRHHEAGFSQVTNLVQNHKRVLSVFLAHQNKIDFKKLTHELLVPLFYANQLRQNNLAPK